MPKRRNGCRAVSGTSIKQVSVYCLSINFNNAAKSAVLLPFGNYSLIIYGHTPCAVVQIIHSVPSLSRQRSECLMSRRNWSVAPSASPTEHIGNIIKEVDPDILRLHFKLLDRNLRNKMTRSFSFPPQHLLLQVALPCFLFI
jgi:hypothetical protein